MELKNYHFNAFITENNDLQDLPIIDDLEKIIDNNIASIISLILMLLSLYFIGFIN